MNNIADAKTQSLLARRVRAIQSGNTLSKRKALDAHQKFVKEREIHAKKRAAFRRQSLSLQKQMAAALVKENPAVRSAVQALQASVRRHTAVKVRRPSYPRVFPRISPGSILSVLVPPYWNIWTSFTAPNSGGDASSITGNFGSDAVGAGGSNTGYGGIAGAYFPVSDSPVGHFRPFVRYSYNWIDSSVLYTAHTDGYIHAAVYDFNPSGNISQWPPMEQTVTLWQDGTGWYEQHSDSGDSVWTGVIDVAFPLTPGHAYALWVWTEVHADDNGASAFAFSFAQANVQAICPFMVIEEAQA